MSDAELRRRSRAGESTRRGLMKLTKTELVRRLMDDTTELQTLREREAERTPVETALFKLRVDFEQATKWVRQEVERAREDAEKMTKQAVTILDTGQKLIEVAHFVMIGKIPQ